MNKSSIFPLAPETKLEEFRAIIEDKEYYLGQLLAVSPYRLEATWLTYTLDTPSKKEIQVEELANGAVPTEKTGYELICIGDCYIESVAKAVAVYRKNTDEE